MQRRDFIKSVGAAALATGCRPLLAHSTTATESARDLIVIELTGGNDGLNTVIPFADDHYIKARPTLRVPADLVVRLGDELGLHPSLRPLEAHFKEGTIAIVHGVGYPRPDRSHFRSLDIWHSGVPDRVDLSTGWIGRALASDAKAKKNRPPALFAIGSAPCPLAYAGAPTTVNTINREEELVLHGGQPRRELLRAHAREPKSNDDLEFLRRSTQGALTLESRLAASKSRSKPGAFPAGEFGRSLELTTRLMRSSSGSGIYFLRMNGFDTHSRQAASHPTLLDILGRGLDGLLRELAKDERGRAATVLVYTEFGRRVRENASRGTDHGAAGPLFLLGSRVQGGFHGHPPDLEKLVDGDLAHEIDFRSIQRQVLERALGLELSARAGDLAAAPTLFR